MSFNNETYSQIENYLKGTLSAKDLSAFEKRMMSDAALAEEVELQRMVMAVTEASAYQDLRETVGEGIKKHDRSVKSKWWAIGGLSIVLISALIFVGKEESQQNISDSSVADQQTIVQDKVPYSEPETSPKEDEQPPLLLEKENKEPEIIKEPVAKEADIPVLERDTGFLTNNAETEPEKPKVLNDTIKKTPGQEQGQEHTEKQVLVNNNRKAEEKSVAEKTPENKCAGFTFLNEPEVSGSCKEESSGTIDFSDINIEEGKKPYSFSRKKNGEVSKLFTNLSTGSHRFYIKDQNGCIDSMQVYVFEEECAKKDFIINTSINEEWEVPVEEGAYFTLKIYDIGGKLVFEKSESYPFQWNGTDSYGKMLPAGIYVYIIEKDGGQETGKITITR